MYATQEAQGRGQKFFKVGLNFLAHFP